MRFASKSVRKGAVKVSCLAAGAVAVAVLAASGATGAAAKAKAEAAKGPDWHMNASVIEACSCTMFCQCYFGTKPDAHHEHGGQSTHFCKANNAYKINTGHYGDVKLDGAKWWVTTDLGGDWSKGDMDWAIITFDRATTDEQRDAIKVIASHLFPVKWKSFKTAVGDIIWNHAGGGEAHALLDGGKTAEVHIMAETHSNDPSKPVVIQNLKYWGAPRNDGFVLMPNVIEAYRVGDKAFEFKGTNGFMITFDIDSKTAPPAAGQASY